MPIQLPLCLTIRQSVRGMRLSSLPKGGVAKQLPPRNELIKRVGADLHQSLSNPPLALSLVGTESRAEMRQEMFQRLNFFPSLANLLPRDPSFTTEVLLEVCSLFDPGIVKHQKSVSRLCVMVAAELALSAEATDRLSMTALLHDTGKPAVHKPLWDKKGKFTPEEARLKETHLTFALEF